VLIENASATGNSDTFDVLNPAEKSVVAASAGSNRTQAVAAVDAAHAAADSGDILTVSEELVLENRDTTSLDARLLQAFDRSRRRLSLQLCEHEGLFVGFDILEFFQVPTGPQLRALITASVREDRGTRHAVEYRATLVDGHDSGTRLDLARAAGWTLTHAGESATVPVHIPPANYAT
jgi:hypothetical protein